MLILIVTLRVHDCEQVGRGQTGQTAFSHYLIILSNPYHHFVLYILQVFENWIGRVSAHYHVEVLPTSLC